MNVMFKIFLGFFLLNYFLVNNVLAGVSREDMNKIASGFRNSCVKKLGITDLTGIEGIRNGVFPDNDSQLKCYTKCIANLMKIFRDGKPDLDKIIKQIGIMMSDDIAGDIMNGAKECYSEINLQEEDVCELAWQYVTCTYRKNPEQFFFP